MKLLLAILTASSTLATAQEVVTHTVAAAPTGPHTTNTLAIESDQSVEIIGLFPHGSPNVYAAVERNGDLLQSLNRDSFDPSSVEYRGEWKFGGPVTIVLSNGDSQQTASCTLEIMPGPYPPDKSAVIGERDGPMKCTLQESTDLVNWTQSTSGATHTLTNANAKKFFRIKLEQDITP